MAIKESFLKTLFSIRVFQTYSFYKKQFRQYCKDLGIPDKKVPGEDEFLKRWAQFDKKVEPYSYRLFSKYCGSTADIIPENIGKDFIEPVLNPERYRTFYEDKNMYEMYLPASALPMTVCKRIDGGPILDGNNQIVTELNVPSGLEKLILKPSTDSSSGRGIELFTKTAKGWVSTRGQELTLDYLRNYNSNFMLQEAIQPHPDIAAYCESSVNTFRVATYRSVVDNQVHVICAIIRIGKDGSYVDNAHSGGRFCGVDVHTGRLSCYLMDTYGNAITDWNNVNFDKTEHVIPHWDRIKDFAIEVASANPHMRLLAQDICLDQNGEPKLIEYNVDGFSYWLFMYFGQTPFGPFTTEIIDYCSIHRPNSVKINALRR